jgi:hypothetical protein
MMAAAEEVARQRVTTKGEVLAIASDYYAKTCKDGTVYVFFRGKIKGKEGDKSAPRAFMVVSPTGEVNPMREIGSYQRKKLARFLRKF